jgi:hypothetical protein
MQLTFRLPDTIAPGDASLSVGVNGTRTNTAFMKIKG